MSLHQRGGEGVRPSKQGLPLPRITYEADGLAEARRMLYPLLEGVRKELEHGTGVELSPLLTEGAYMSYPNGGFYRRHIDSYPNTPQECRKFSYLLYCNPNWKPSDGGCLRLHDDGGAEVAPAGARPCYVDVEPRAGTLVVFRSDVPHEVLDTSASRLAIAGWFNSPPEGSAGRRTAIAALGATLVVGSALKAGLRAIGGASSADE